MLRIILFIFNVLCLCAAIADASCIDIAGYREVRRFKCFASIANSAWKNDGIAGKYSSSHRLIALAHFNTDCDTESLLGFCRSFFLCSTRLASAKQLRVENISGDALRALYQKNVKSIQSDLNVSNEEAQKLAFITCFDASWSECIDALNSVLGNGRNRRSMGISHKYSLEDAYVILHMHPNVYFWHYFTSPSEDMELYVNAIAGALNTIMNSNPIILDEHFNRQTVLKLIVREYFDKFILQSKTKS